MNDISEEFSVRITRDANTGKKLTEEWLLDNQRHRADGPAWIEYDRSTGKPVAKEWYMHGKCHRTDGPRALYFNAITGKPRTEDWGVNDLEHRIGKPSHIEYDDRGRVILEEWREAGSLHREDGGPARRQINPDNGIVYSEEWYLFGKRHNIFGPAAITRERETGKIVEQLYYQADKRLAGAHLLPNFG